MNINYNPIAHLSSALLRGNPNTDLMAFITGYFDESYSQKPKPLIYTVGGYISTHKKWIKFNDKWQAVLDRENLPPFSMKDAPTLCKDWTKERQKSLLEELHAIIKETYLCGFSVSVIVDDYNSLSEEIQIELGSPHLVAATFCLLLVTGWAYENNLQEPIDYVFEKGAKDENLLDLIFNHLFTDEMQSFFRMNSFSFFRKKVAPLQAADILAYETRLNIMQRYPTEKPREMRKSLENIIDWNRNRWIIVDKTTLEWFINRPSFKDTSYDYQIEAEIKLARKRGII